MSEKLNNPKTVPLTSLSPVQLKNLLQNIDSEIETVSDHLRTLRYATKRYEDSQAALESVSTNPEGTPCLIPLTQSVFVEGFLKDTDTCLIHLGTNYYVKQSVTEALKYFTRVIKSLKTTCSDGIKNQLNNLYAQRRPVVQLLTQLFTKQNPSTVSSLSDNT